MGFLTWAPLLLATVGIAHELRPMSGLQTFEDRDVAADGTASHIEADAQLRIGNLHLPGLANQLPSRQDVHWYNWDVAESLQQGDLVHRLRKFWQPADVWAVTKIRSENSARTRLCIRHLRARLAAGRYALASPDELR
jgi:hypothetical protein